MNFLYSVICGLTQYTNKAHLARAALEAVCFQTREVYYSNNICSSSLSVNIINRKDFHFAGNTWKYFSVSIKKTTYDCKFPSIDLNFRQNGSKIYGFINYNFWLITIKTSLSVFYVDKSDLTEVNSPTWPLIRLAMHLLIWHTAKEISPNVSMTFQMKILIATPKRKIDKLTRYWFSCIHEKSKNR